MGNFTSQVFSAKEEGKGKGAGRACAELENSTCPYSA